MARPKQRDVLILFEHIANKIYIARNITLQSTVIEDCLNDICKISNRFNDHNGESSDQEIRVQSNKTLNTLIEKYK